MMVFWNVKASQGRVRFIVNDTQTVNNTFESNVYILEPSYLEIHIKEFHEGAWEDQSLEGLAKKKYIEDEEFDDTWNLIKGRLYYIRVYVFDEKRNQFYITKNAKIAFELNN